MISRRRGVAQPGSAPALGAGGRKFESCLPDQTTSDPHGLEPRESRMLGNPARPVRRKAVGVRTVSGTGARCAHGGNDPAAHPTQGVARLNRAAPTKSTFHAVVRARFWVGSLPKGRPSGSSSVGRASAFQAECREFESRLPLHTFFPAPVAQWIEQPPSKR